MNMKKKGLIIAGWIAVGVLFSSLYSVGEDPEPLTDTEKETISNLSQAELKKHVMFLASDELEGRGTGTEEQEIAARYIASHFKAWGLKPHRKAKDLDGYYQKFSIGDREYRTTLKLREEDETRTISGEEQINVLHPGSAGTFEAADLVFAGYGIKDGDRGYNDYKNVDVRDKFVVIFRHEPNESDPNSKFNGNDWTDNAYFRTKYREAKENGARGLILLNDPLGNHGQVPANRIRASGDMPFLSVSEDVASTLLRRSPEELKTLQKKIDEEPSPRSFVVENVALEVTLTEEESQKNTVRNVVGVLEGSDPELRDEWIVVGGHYDHLGTAEDGNAPRGARPKGDQGRYSIEDLKRILKERGDDLSKRQKKRIKRAIERKKKQKQNDSSEEKDASDTQEKDRIWNGADDNASGTTGVMMLARMLSGLPEGKRPKRSILFLLFTAEELGLVGSRYYGNNPIVPFGQTVAMVNMDMIGRSKDGSVSLRSVAASNYLKSRCKEILPNFDLKPRFPEEVSNRSDHAAFLEQEIPAIFFFTGTHKHYHRPGDEWPHLNYNHMKEIISAQFVLLKRLARTADVPDFRGQQRTLSRPSGNTDEREKRQPEEGQNRKQDERKSGDPEEEPNEDREKSSRKESW